MRKLVELNHVLEDGMKAYPGLPSPKIGTFLGHKESRSHYDAKAEFYLGKGTCRVTLAPIWTAPFIATLVGET